MAKPSKTAKVVDRISKLPVEIRLHILSLTTTKSAVRMGAVSKAWSRLWTSSPTLIFRQNEFAIADDSSFETFIDRSLALHNPSVSIRRFELFWYRSVQMHKIDTWLYYLLNLDIREIVLMMPSKGRLMLPATLFCCPSLEYCHLNADVVINGTKSRMFFEDTAQLVLPSIVALSKLRSLRLEYTIIPIGSLQGIVSGCPLLERLYVAVRGSGLVKVPAPKLKVLFLSCIIEDADSRIEISAPRLEQLYCLFMVFLAEIDLGNVESLASVRVKCWKGDCDGAKLIGILTGSPNVTNLSMEKYVMKCLSVVPDLSQQGTRGGGLPPMSRRERLRQQQHSNNPNLPKPSSAHCLSLCHLKYLRLEVSSNDDNFRVIIILLKYSTNLEKLVINNFQGDDIFPDVTELEDGWFSQKLDVDCNLDHLKEVEITGFLGAKDALELVKLLLQRASALQNMILNYEKDWPLSWKETYQKMLSMIPPASSSVRILLSSTTEPC